MIEKTNMKKLFLATLFVLFNAQANAATVEIYSLDLMDDQRGFCIDIRGHKSKAINIIQSPSSFVVSN